jgi:hypothetical protein
LREFSITHTRHVPMGMTCLSCKQPRITGASCRIKDLLGAVGARFHQRLEVRPFDVDMGRLLDWRRCSILAAPLSSADGAKDYARNMHRLELN